MLSLLTYTQTTLGALVAWTKDHMHDEDGAVATEYVLLLTFIAIAIIAVVTLFGKDLINLFNNSCGKLNTATGVTPTAGC